MSQEITIQKEVSVYEQKATALTITSPEEMKEAVVLLSQTNKTLDNLNDEKNKVARPLLDAIAAERKRWKPFETALTNAVTTIRTKMMAYQKEEDRKRAIAEQKIVARVEKGTMRIDTASTKLANLPDIDVTVSTDAGAVQWRTIKKLIVDDIAQIPHEYFNLDEKRLTDALKAGATVQGAHLEDEKVPANYR